MRLEELCTAFPKDQSEWQIPHPGRAFSETFRTKVRAMYGKIFAAMDLNRLRAPSRLGIATRPYQAGDPLKTLALSQFVQNESLHTRIDSAPGRNGVCIVVHTSSSLSFASGESNKGQLALCAAGLIEAMHGEAMQTVQMHYVDGEDFETEVAALKGFLKRYRFCYFISDFLYAKSREAMQQPRFADVLLDIGVLHAGVIVVRDVYEWHQNNPLGQVTEKLDPLGAQNETPLFSGRRYLQNVEEQFQYLKETLLEKTLSSCVGVTKNTSTSDFVTEILSHLSRARKSL